MVRLKPWHLIAVVVGVVLIALLYARYERAHAAEEVGKWSAIAKRLQRDSAQQSRGIVRVDSVFTRDTITLRRTETRYRTLRDTVLQRLTDTVTVERFIRLADSTVLACRETLSSCEHRVAARDSLIVTLGHQRDADRRLFAAKLRQATPRVVPWLAGGVDPFDHRVQIARAGLDVRVLGPVRLTGDVAYHTLANHHRAAFVGVKLTF